MKKAALITVMAAALLVQPAATQNRDPLPCAAETAWLKDAIYVQDVIRNHVHHSHVGELALDGNERALEILVEMDSLIAFPHGDGPRHTDSQAAFEQKSVEAVDANLLQAHFAFQTCVNGR